MNFRLNKGTVLTIGTMPVRLKSDTDVDIEAHSTDHIAEMFANSAGPRAFGEHLAQMKHTEVKSFSRDDKQMEVEIEVTYGAGGARQERELGAPREVPRERARAAAAVDRTPLVDAPPGVAVKRFPPDVETATDPPLIPPSVVAPVARSADDEVVLPGGGTDKSDDVPSDKQQPDKPPSDDLPPDFPGLAHLKEHDPPVTKWSEVTQYTQEELQKINNIGPKTAADIIAAVEKRADSE